MNRIIVDLSKKEKIGFGVAFFILMALLISTAPVLAKKYNNWRATTPLPEVGGYVIVAYVDEKKGMVTLNESLGITCVHRSVALDGTAPFSCWDVDTAPKKIQELIKNRK